MVNCNFILCSIFSFIGSDHVCESNNTGFCLITQIKIVGFNFFNPFVLVFFHKSRTLLFLFSINSLFHFIILYFRIYQNFKYFQMHNKKGLYFINVIGIVTVITTVHIIKLNLIIMIILRVPKLNSFIDLDRVRKLSI